MSDRKVTTDALDTLGTIIDESQKRDAIHLAVENVIAGETVLAGDHIYLENGVAYRGKEKALGIVDPFLKSPVMQGQRFWMVIYPRVITSLRHVWSHPELPDEISGEELTIPNKSKQESEEWLRNFFESHYMPDYKTAMAFIESSDIDDYGDDCWMTFYGEDAHANCPPEFWDHYENVTGKDVSQLRRVKAFSCTC